jgi:GT2 family glycosyltransferase
MKVSVLIGSRNRPMALQRCLESVLMQQHSELEVLILDDASEDPIAYQRCIEQIGDSRVVLTRSEKQLGVAGGRNLLFAQASGDIFFVLDDDAVIAGIDTITRLCDIFTTCPEIGIVACQIVEYSSDGKILRKVPFSRRLLARFPHLAEKPQFVSYFLGGAHGIRRQVIETCGHYHPDLMFGEEELDLAYRVLEHQWQIFYDPKIVVYHYPSPSVISKSNSLAEELLHHVKNRIYLAYRYLPLPYLPIHLLIWLIIYSAMAVRAKAPFTLLRGIRAGIQMSQQAQRQPLSRSTITYLRAHNGRLWY